VVFYILRDEALGVTGNRTGGHEEFVVPLVTDACDLDHDADLRTSRSVHARVVTGNVAAEISRVAAQVGADLILVGVTRRGMFGRLFGSTAARVIRTARRPVLTIPLLAEQKIVPVADRDPMTLAA
jgi:hypothetical protein